MNKKIKQFRKNGILIKTKDGALLPNSSIAKEHIVDKKLLIRALSEDELPDYDINFQDHVNNKKNPHNVTADQIGKNLAQWNASKIQNYSVSNIAPIIGQVLVWNGTEYVPSSTSIQGNVLNSILSYNGTAFAENSNVLITNNGELSGNHIQNLGVNDSPQFNRINFPRTSGSGNEPYISKNGTNGLHVNSLELDLTGTNNLRLNGNVVFSNKSFTLGPSNNEVKLLSVGSSTLDIKNNLNETNVRVFDGTDFINIRGNGVFNTSNDSPIVFEATTSQTSNITEWKDSSGNVIAFIAADGSSSFLTNPFNQDLNTSDSPSFSNIYLDDGELTVKTIKDENQDEIISSNSNGLILASGLAFKRVFFKNQGGVDFESNDLYGDHIQNLGLYDSPSFKSIQTKIVHDTTIHTSDYNISDDDSIILVDSSNLEVNITLPNPDLNKGKVYVVKKIDQSFNQVIINQNISESIDGDVNYIIDEQYITVSVVSDGTNWHII